MGDVTSDFATDRDAFAQKCKADLAFTQKVLAAVLANPETKLVFHSEMEKQSATTYVHEGLNLSSTTSYSYNLKPIEQRLSLSVNSGGGGLPPGSGAGSSQLVLLGYNGDWSGLLPKAAKLLKILPIGALVTALTQAIFGTKLGPLILAALLAL